MLYNESDTYLLADVFIHFRKTMHSKFGLDPCQYISLPSYGFQSMLKMTKVKLDHIYDIDMYLFLTQQIRGGLSFIANRFETSINPVTLVEDRSLLYYDANNLLSDMQIFLQKVS